MNTFLQKLPFALLASAILSTCGPAIPDCADWNSRDFFKTATVADVATCLGNGADIGARAEGGLTPLHIAAHSGTPETVNALVAAGADIGARDEGGWTPLHGAAGPGTPETVNALVAAGADIGARAEFGATPLHFAAVAGTPETVMALLAAGADPKARADGELLPADLAEDNARVKNHPVFWELSEAKYK